MSDRPLPPVPPGEAQGWRLTVDGAEMRCSQARLRSPIGTWSYGWHPHGYDTWWFWEQGGGGALTLPHSTRDGELLVGLIVEDRPNMGGPTPCAIGGYVEPGEAHAEAAAREADEETGLSGSRVALGSPVNPNRAFFQADLGALEGVHLYALQVDSRALRRHPDGGYTWTTTRRAEVAEVRFWPWREAIARTADGMALAAIARLLATVPRPAR